ncbi:unnamed protein product [Symbiodinium sp. CCMP2592]|nr:unnamed protein product [Symbiodinium sp. CCMP2592]
MSNWKDFSLTEDKCRGSAPDWKVLPLESDGSESHRGKKRAGSSESVRNWTDFPLDGDLEAQGQNPVGSSWKDLPLDGEVPLPRGRNTTHVSGAAAVRIPPSKKPCVDKDSWKNCLSAEETVAATDSGPLETLEVNLTRELLSCLPKLPLSQQTSYALSGKDSGRIQTALKAGCSCSANCLSKLHKAPTEAIVRMWHDLSPETHVMVLHGLYDCPEQMELRRRHWAVNSQHVCFRGLAKLLGHNERTLRKCIHADADKRRSPDLRLPRDCPQTTFVHHFFLDLYLSAAEDLNVDAVIEKGEAAEPHTFHWSPDTPVVDRILALLSDNCTAPVRWLPPGQLSDLWLQFLSWSESHSRVRKTKDAVKIGPVLQFVPGWYTFYNAWKQHWHLRRLRFRPTSSHKECDVCFQLREALHLRSLSKDEKVAKAAEWRQHLADTYHDRLVYYTMRYASRARLNILTVILDSMDKAKWSYPRMNISRQPESLEKLRRPRLVVTAALAHGFATGLFIQDSERVSHGANCFLDQLCRTIQVVRAQGPCPEHLFLQTDNTTALSKNSSSHLFAALLVALKHFSTVNLGYLTKGHTHEDVDAYFSRLLPIIRRSEFNTVSDAADVLRGELQGEAHGHHDPVVVQEVKAVKDFDAWLHPLGIKLHNTFRTRVDPQTGQERPTAHAFTYKRRLDLTMEERRRVPAVNSQGHPDDVFGIVKGRMFHDIDEAHAPLLVLPHSRLETLGSIRDLALEKRNLFSQQRAKELQKLADTLDDIRRPQGAASVRNLLAGDATLEEYSGDMSWLAQPGQVHHPALVVTDILSSCSPGVDLLGHPASCVQHRVPMTMRVPEAILSMAVFGTCLQAVLDWPGGADQDRQLDVFEIWSGVGSICAAAQKAGLAADAFELTRIPGVTDDPSNPATEDLLCKAGFFRCLAKVLTVREKGLVWMGPPCSSWVFLNQRNCKRNAHNRGGDGTYKPVADGNTFARIAAFIFALCSIRNVFVVIEQPKGSQMWFYDPVQLVLNHFQCTWVTMARCRFDRRPYGQRWLKVFKICGPWWIDQLYRQCLCPGEHKPLVTVSESGQITGNTEALKSSAAYPKAMGEAVIKRYMAIQQADPPASVSHKKPAALHKRPAASHKRPAASEAASEKAPKKLAMDQSWKELKLEAEESMNQTVSHSSEQQEEKGASAWTAINEMSLVTRSAALAYCVGFNLTTHGDMSDMYLASLCAQLMRSQLSCLLASNFHRISRISGQEVSEACGQHLHTAFCMLSCTEARISPSPHKLATMSDCRHGITEEPLQPPAKLRRLGPLREEHIPPDEKKDVQSAQCQEFAVLSESNLQGYKEAFLLDQKQRDTDSSSQETLVLGEHLLEKAS